MSSIIRSASFLRVKTASRRDLGISDTVSSLEDHNFFFDADSCSLLAQDWTKPALAFARLGEMGGVQGLAKAFRTDLQTGVYKDEVSIGFDRRQEVYGKNIFPKKPPRHFLSLCADELKDPMLIILMVAGTISIVAGAIDDPSHGWVEGVAILIAVAIVTLISAGNNYRKEQQFRSMDAEKDQKVVIVLRGKAEYEIPNTEVNVGDIVLLQTGGSVPCDGVWVSGTDNLHCEESSLTGESKNIRKDFQHPFFLAGSQVVDGESAMLATAVGTRTTWGSLMSRLDEDRPQTPLQEKLEHIAKVIGYGGAIIAVVLFSILLVRWIVEIEQNNKVYDEELRELLDNFIIAVTIVVVAVPEGLPLAVTISLAYSMKKMYYDHNFVRVLAACETMGNATTICSDKTGTLTTNKMTVIKAWLAQTFYKDGLPASAELNADVRTILLEGLAVNSRVFETSPKDWADPETPQYTGGNETECALLRWAVTLNVKYKDLREQFPVEKAYPFSSLVKRSSVLIKYKGIHRMYLKGAAERVLALCTSYINTDGKVIPLSEETLKEIENAIEDMVRTGLRCICVAYRDYDNIQYDQSAEPVPIDPPIEDYVCIGVSGIKDPVRKEVPQAVKRCQMAGIVVRMVTGDHLETAKFIAKDCGILTGDDSEIAMTGTTFREMSPEELEQTLPNLRVLARSTPSDKERLVRWYMDHGEVVGVTGDGANDALALKEAHVGLAMGIQGTDVAKEASDIIILDDNFRSIVETVKWGRSVYDNIRKFVQFQLTVNVVALTVSIVGALAGFPQPLAAVQLLWVNLIMDTLAALAFGTEAPTYELLDRKPYARDCGLVSPIMWRAIFGQSFLQLIILFIMILPPTDPVGLRLFSITTTDEEEWTNILRTCVFNTFVFLQIFNQINARKVNNELNPFARIFDNRMFSYIFVFIVALQVLMVEVFGAFAKTVGLTSSQWGICIALGVLSIPWGFVLHFIPVNVNHGFIQTKSEKSDIQLKEIEANDHRADGPLMDDEKDTTD
uniref:Calcium-transporting ATPase n=1 Tax=Hirondellea gigas TaxID=1518452 RepID=A0A6A7G4K6_9CRUS